MFVMFVTSGVVRYKEPESHDSLRVQRAGGQERLQPPGSDSDPGLSSLRFDQPT